MNDSLHVILGAGQIGTKVATQLAARGQRVRLVRRGPSVELRGIETRSADLGDPEAAIRAMAGAAVVYNCVNPPYDRWATELPRLTDGILSGAARAGARLVVLDNLYAYGDTARMTEDTPFAPVSKKGEYRARETERLLAAHRAGDVRVAIGRASDFFGPDTPLAHFGERFYQRVLAGKPGECIGDPDMPHTYSYSLDVARGLVALGLDARADGKSWMLPVQPAESARAVTDRMGKALGRELRITRIPRLAMRLLGVVSSQMRELVEMTYQWEQPFVVDDSRFRATFGVPPTDWDAAIAATVGWAAATYARAKAA